MALETELKMRVEQHETTREALKRSGAKFIRRELETNTFLDTPDSRLLSQGSGLRVRRAENLETGEVRCIITHKGPRRAGPMKVREETEASARDYDEAVRLLSALGYEVRLSFEKKRETWELDGCEVVLDSLPEAVGQFVEIEGESAEGIEGVRRKIGLSSAAVEPEGYATIISAYLKSSGRRVLTFA